MTELVVIESNRQPKKSTTTKSNNKSQFYVFDFACHANQLVLFGKQKGKDDTVCLRLSKIPCERFFLQLRSDVKFTNEQQIKDEVKNFLGPDFPHDDADFKQRHRFIAPVISMKFEDNMKYSSWFDQPDIPPEIVQMEIDKKVQKINQDKPANRKQPFGPPSTDLLHLPIKCKIQTIQVDVYKSMSVKQSPFVDNLNHRELRDHYKPSLFFCAVWRETLNPIERFCVDHCFPGHGWIKFTDAREVLEKSRISNCSRELTCDWVNVAMPKSDKSKWPIPTFQTVYLSLEHDKLLNRYNISYESTRWTPTKCTESTPLDKQNIPRQILSLTAEHVIQHLTPILENVDMIVGYKWHISEKFPGSKHEQFYGIRSMLSQLGLRTNRAKYNPQKFQEHKGNRNIKPTERFGTLWCDAFRCIHQETLFPSQESYSLPYLQTKFVGRVDNDVKQPISIAWLMHKLMEQHEIMDMLWQWALISKSPWQVCLQQNMIDLNDFLMIREFADNGYLIRTPGAPTRSSTRLAEQSLPKPKLDTTTIKNNTHDNIEEKEQKSSIPSLEVNYRRIPDFDDNKLVTKKELNTSTSKQNTIKEKILPINEFSNQSMLFSVGYGSDNIKLSNVISLPEVTPVVLEEKRELTETDLKDLEGGLNLDVKRGVYKYVTVMDFQSTYPSIMYAANLCFSTLRFNALHRYDPDLINISVLERQAWRRNTSEVKSRGVTTGVIPSLCLRLLNDRITCQDEAKAETDAQKKGVLLRRAKVLKLVANSIYGCLGSMYGRFGFKNFARYITGMGQKNLLHVKLMVETPLDNGSSKSSLFILPPHLRVVVVGGNTDSLLLKADGPLLESLHTLADDPKAQFLLLHRSMQEISTLINEKLPGMQFNVEQEFILFMCMEKQKYVGWPFLYRIEGEGRSTRTSSNTTTINKEDVSIDNVIPIPFTIDSVVCKGFSRQQLGMAKFIRDIRFEMLLTILGLMHTRNIPATTTATPVTTIMTQTQNEPVVSSGAVITRVISNLPIEPKSTNNRTFTPQELLSQCVKEVIRIYLQALRSKILQKRVFLEDFVITNRLNKPLSSYMVDDSSYALPFVHAAKLRDMITHQRDHPCQNDTIDYVMCFDHTSPDRVTAIPIELAIGMHPNLNWYMESLRKALLSILNPCAYVNTQDEFDTVIRNELAEIRSDSNR